MIIHPAKRKTIRLWLCLTRMLLLWRHNGRDNVWNHQPHDCLLNRLFRRRWKKTSKLCVTGLCSGDSQGPGEFPAQRASNAENVSIWWRHHDFHLSHVFANYSSEVFKLDPGRVSISNWNIYTRCLIEISNSASWKANQNNYGHTKYIT